MSIKFDQYTNTLSVDDNSVTNADMNLVPEGTGAVTVGSKSLAYFSFSTGSNYVALNAFNSGATADFVINSQPASGTASLSFRTQNSTQLQVSHTSSAVNYVQITGAATGANPAISIQGSDANRGFQYWSKGSGAHLFYSNSGTNLQFRVDSSTSAINYLQVSGNYTNSPPVISAQGSDTNISLAIQSKGTGAIDLAAGSSGVNISNGGTVTALTFTASGNAYTSFPSIAITAPTTAGGVQATATLSRLFQNIATVAGGGTGYTVGDTLTVVGGTPAGAAATLTVSSVSGGVITAVASANFAQYTALPTNPVSVTGGTGSGATLNLQWSVLTGAGSYTITNAGSGYVEQPTVTFSGGGGSGAAAYATVGSGTVVRGVGSTLSFYTPGGEQARIADSGATAVDYVQLSGAANSSPNIRSNGASANSNLSYGATGNGSHIFYTAGLTTNQFRITHTASAVNYVQVTGGSTGNGAIVSAQGSDTNVGFRTYSKGSGSISFWTAGGSSRQFQVSHASGTVVNYATATGSITGAAPVFSVEGSDTNIPLVLQPKGTGALQAQQTDSTATGGNARGANAVDWQTTRSAAAQVASAQYSVISGGSGNTANSYNATVVAGAGNVSQGNYNFIGGGASNVANSGFLSSFSSVVGGYINTANGFYNFVGGGFTNSGTSASAVTTQSATMNGTTAVTLSGSNANIKVGQYISGTSIATDTYVAAISGTSLTLSKNASGSSTSTLSFYTPHGVVVGGGNNQATGSYSFIGGGGDAGTAGNRNVASGDWSTVAGGQKNTASSAFSFVGGGYGNTASTNFGAAVVGGGFYGNLVTQTAPSTASGVSSFIGGGYNNVASGTTSSVLGSDNSANASYSALLGGTRGTARSITGNLVFPACNTPISTTQGSTQAALLVLGVQTTDATATVLRSDSSAAGTTNQVILPNNSAYYFKGSIVAGVTGAGDTSSWEFVGTIKRGANAGTTALVGTPALNLVSQDTGASTWTVALTADTTNGGLAVTVTGQASTTIRWVAKIETTEMTF